MPSMLQYPTDKFCQPINEKDEKKDYEIDSEKHSIHRSSPHGYSLEKRLFHALHAQKINTPTIKEFQECWAFANSLRSYYFKKSKKSQPLGLEVVIDVAGGHGALGALFLLLLPSVKRSIVIDPAIVEAGKRGIQNAWFEGSTVISEEKNSSLVVKNGKMLEYKHESLFTALPSELNTIVHEQNIDNTKILVVACHACQHLSDATLQISEQYGVHVAVMPCCQKDHGGSWKAAANNLGITLNKSSTQSRGGGVGIIMDLLSAGKMMSEHAGSSSNVRYEVKMKVIDPKITPQNRLIMCKAVKRKEDEKISPSGKSKNNVRDNTQTNMAVKEADLKLQRAYKRAHKVKKTSGKEKESIGLTIKGFKNLSCVQSAIIGFGFGVLFSVMVSKRSNRIIQ